MYEIIKNVIASGKYELTDMLKKIDTIWLQGNLTDDDRAELITLAREHANPENTYNLQRQVENLYVTVAELAKRIVALENGTAETPVPEEPCPEYVQPTGAHDAYNTGDQITYNGSRYICKMDNCVWAPDVYPAGWELVATSHEEVGE